MRINNTVKIISQRFKKYQKKSSLGPSAFYSYSSYTKSTSSIIKCCQSARVLQKQVTSFLRSVSAMNGAQLKKNFKKINLKKAVLLKSSFTGIFSKKSNGMRMGSGKGSILESCAVSRKGSLLFKFSYKFQFFFFRFLLKRAIKKLPPKSFVLFFL